MRWRPTSCGFAPREPRGPSPFARGRIVAFLPDWSISVHRSLQLVSGKESSLGSMSEGLEDNSRCGTLSDSPQPRWLVPTPSPTCCELGEHHVLRDRLNLPSTLDSGFPGAPASVRPSPWPSPFAPWSSGLPQNNGLGTERGPEGLIALLPLNCSLFRPVPWLWSAGIQ